MLEITNISWEIYIYKMFIKFILLVIKLILRN